MKIERFQQLAEAYGGDLSRWPTDERKPACLLMESDATARRIINDELALDAVLNQATKDDDPARVDRMAAAVASRLDQRMAAGGSALPVPVAPRWAVGFLCAMALAGVLSGALSAPTAQSAAASVTIADVAGAAGYSSTRLLAAWAQ